MKRYTREFIHDEIGYLEPWEHKRPQMDDIAKLKKILELCEKGYITDFEAIKETVAVYTESEARRLPDSIWER